MQTEKLPFLQTVGKACVYGFYTPVGRSLQTTLALTMGQLLAADKRVLYLNFECCAGLTEMLGKQADNTEFASLLYYLQESKEQFLGRLYQAAECINGMDFILPASCGYDLYGIAREEWRRLLDLLDDGQYDVILLDLSDGVQGLFDVLRRCTRIYTIVREDGFAAREACSVSGDAGTDGLFGRLGALEKVKIAIFLPTAQGHRKSVDRGAGGIYEESVGCR